MLTASLTEQRQRKPADLNIVLKSSTSNKSHSHLRRSVYIHDVVRFWEGGGVSECDIIVHLKSEKKQENEGDF